MAAFATAGMVTGWRRRMSPTHASTIARWVRALWFVRPLPSANVMPLLNVGQLSL
jgi:hypothetical protein